MERMKTCIEDISSRNPLLVEYRGKISFVLAGSRAVGYHVPSSDYDILGVCDHDTYRMIAELADRQASAGHIDIFMNRESEDVGKGYSGVGSVKRRESKIPRA